MASNATTERVSGSSQRSKPAIAPNDAYPVLTQSLPVGISVGNNGLKMHADGADYFLSSLIQLDYDAPLGDGDAGEGVQVEVVSSTNASIDGHRFWCGRAAWDNNSTATKRLHDADDGKRKFSPYMVLAAIGLLPLRKHHNWRLFLSAPYKGLADVLRSELSHTFTLRLNGNLCTAALEVVGVRPEAHAAAFYIASQAKAQGKQGDILVIDWGEGNTTLCHTDEHGKLKRHVPLDSGVSALLDAIAYDERVIRANRGFASDREGLRLGIENGSFRIGGQRGADFSTVYSEKLAIWASQKIDQIKTAANEAWSKSAIVAAVGGGANLPGLQELLAREGVAIAPQAQFLDARGLALMAELSGGE